MTSHPPATKADLRRHFRACRRSIAADLRRANEQRIMDHLARALERHRARCVAAFLAFDGEPDLEPLLRAWQGPDRLLALPIVPDTRDGAMTLREWLPDAGMARNALGIREPVVGREVGLGELDMVLLPLVAFDTAGNRLGMGAGYYDRFLAAGPVAGPPLRIGIAHACQQAEGLPHDSWDIPLHAVVTENGWIECPS